MTILFPRKLNTSSGTISKNYIITLHKFHEKFLATDLPGIFSYLYVFFFLGNLIQNMDTGDNLNLEIGFKVI